MTKWTWAQIAVLVVVLAALIAARIQVGPTPMVAVAWSIWGLSLAIVVSGVLLKLRRRQ